MDVRFSMRNSSGIPRSVDRKNETINGCGSGSMRGDYDYSNSRSYRSGNGYITKARNVPSSITATMTNGSLNEANTLLTRATNHYLPPLQALVAVTDAIALRFGLRRFADGYGRDGDEAVQIPAQRQCKDSLKHQGRDGCGSCSDLVLGNPHISLAWALSNPGLEPVSNDIDNNINYYNEEEGKDVDTSLRCEYASLLTKLTRVVLVFRQVKIKIGRDVCCVRLQGRRGADRYGAKEGSDAHGVVKSKNYASFNRVGDKDRDQATVEEAEEEAESDLLEAEEAEEAEDLQENIRKERNILGYS